MRQTLRKLNTRLAALMLAAVLLLCAVPVASATTASGTCGDNLKWNLSGDTLTITGSGAMYDYPEKTMAPWYEYRKEISAVHLPDGLTRIGDLAFYECSALQIVSMPDTVMEVGWYAFSGCSSMTMLDLSSNLKTIDEGGFRECSALTSLRLPASLTSIGYQGFYRCESLTEITIPSSVKEMGFSAFAFCYNLIRANVQASISKLPDWTFYGCGRLTDVKLSADIKAVGKLAFYNCSSLTNISYPGEEKDREQIDQDIRTGQDSLDGDPVADPKIGGEEWPDSSTNTDYDTDDRDGDVGNTTTTTTKTENTDMTSHIIITYSVNGENKHYAQVNVTLETASAWSEVSGKVADVADSVPETYVDIFIKDDSTLTKGVFNHLIGKPVMITVHNATGAMWKMDCREMEENSTYDLTYERTDATPEQLELMGCTVGYQIKFFANTQVNAEVLIKLPMENTRKNASFYQKKLTGDKELLQTVMVDDDGYAHFYLASVDRKTEYLIGINVSTVEPETAIIPDTLQQDYGVTEQLSDVKYVVTGRTSSWGMNINQVTYILAGGMLGIVVIVGIVMFALNKRKLKKGYIPQWEDDEDE